MTGRFPFNGPLPGGHHPVRCKRCNTLHPPGGHCLSCGFDSGLGGFLAVRPVMVLERICLVVHVLNAEEIKIRKLLHSKLFKNKAR